jgi:hypothetical protein
MFLELNIQSKQKFCYEQDYMANEHYVIRFSLNHKNTELTVNKIINRNKLNRLI